MKSILKNIGEKVVLDLIPIAWLTSFPLVSLPLIEQTDILNALQI